MKFITLIIIIALSSMSCARPEFIDDIRKTGRCTATGYTNDIITIGMIDGSMNQVIAQNMLDFPHQDMSDEWHQKHFDTTIGVFYSKRF